MSDVLQTALARKAELEKELAKIDAFLLMHDRLTGVTRSVKTKGRPHEVLLHIKGLLKEHGAMPRGDILSALTQLGVDVLGDTRVAQTRYIGTICWRNRDIIQNGIKGYYLLPVDTR